MIDLETRLERALQAEAAPPRDPMFRIQLLLRRERKAFRRRLLAGAVATLAIAILASLSLAGLGLAVGGRAAPLASALLSAALMIALATRAVPDLRSLGSGWWASASVRLRALPRPRPWG